MHVLGLAAIEWRPIASPLQIAAAAMLLVGLAVFAYWRSLRGRRRLGILLLAMRIAAIVAVAILLMGPSRTPRQETQAVRPRLAVLVDTSQSMLTRDCEGKSRIDCALERWLSPKQLEELEAEHQVEILAFDENVRPLSREQIRGRGEALAAGKSTALAESVSQALSRFTSGDRGGAILVLSDGRDSEEAPPAPAASRASAMELPIFTVPLGGEGGRPDVALLATPLQEYLLPGEPGAILVRVYQSGLPRASAVLKLTQGGRTEETPVSFNGQGMVEARLAIEHDEEGLYEYAVEISPVPGETETTNNHQTVFCQVQKRRIRVLILEGQPYWDSKFLAQSLRKDERIEVLQITQLSQSKSETIVTRSTGGAPKMPKTAEEWAAYDVVILGQAMENVFDEQTGTMLAGFVDQGGRLVFARGRCYDPLQPGGREIGRQIASIEPVSFAPSDLGAGASGDWKIALAPAGRTNQWLSVAKMGVATEQALARLPGFESAPAIAGEKPGAIVLARASDAGAPSRQGQPALVTMNVGRGEVVGVLGDGSWRWSLLTPENRDLAGFYDAFWSNLVRWLMMGGDFQPGEQAALNLSRTSARLGDAITIDVAYKHSPEGGVPPRLRMTDGGGRDFEIALRKLPGREPRYRAEYEPATVGVHRVELLSPGMVPERQERKFNVYHLNFERLNASANPMALRLLAENSGGAVLEQNQTDELIDMLRRRQAAMVVPPSPEYTWDRWPFMALLLCWCGAEWLLRRRADLM